MSDVSTRPLIVVEFFENSNNNEGYRDHKRCNFTECDSLTEFFRLGYFSHPKMKVKVAEDKELTIDNRGVYLITFNVMKKQICSQ